MGSSALKEVTMRAFATGILQFDYEKDAYVRFSARKDSHFMGNSRRIANPKAVEDMQPGQPILFSYEPGEPGIDAVVVNACDLVAVNEDECQAISKGIQFVYQDGPIPWHHVNEAGYTGDEDFDCGLYWEDMKSMCIGLLSKFDRDQCVVVVTGEGVTP